MEQQNGNEVSDGSESDSDASSDSGSDTSTASDATATPGQYVTSATAIQSESDKQDEDDLDDLFQRALAKAREAQELDAAGLQDELQADMMVVADKVVKERCVSLQNLKTCSHAFIVPLDPFPDCRSRISRTTPLICRPRRHSNGRRKSRYLGRRKWLRKIEGRDLAKGCCTLMRLPRARRRNRSWTRQRINRNYRESKEPRYVRFEIGL